jgi:hypothetical protein
MTPNIPSGPLGVGVWALLVLAVLVVVASAVGLLATRQGYARLHLMTPVTTVAGPALGLALALTNGFGLVTASVLVTVAVLALTGAALQVAMATTVGTRDKAPRE